MNITELADEELRKILITLDGKGKAVKEAALDEIIRRWMSRAADRLVNPEEFS